MFGDNSTLIADMGAPDLERDQTRLMLLGLAGSIVFAARMLLVYAEPHVWRDPQERWMLVLCGLTYVVAWVPLWLLPLDFVTMEFDTRCGELSILSWLQFSWVLVYASNFVLGYLTNDFVRSYVFAGGFTIRRRAVLAWYLIRRFYGLAGAAGMLVVALIAAKWGFFSFETWNLLYSILYALANAYGVGLFIWLLSHALVELPKRLWYLPRREVMLRYACFTAGLAAEELESASVEWDETVEKLVLAGASPAARARWPEQFVVLREAWRLTEATVRTLPIASAQWPVEVDAPAGASTLSSPARSPYVSDGRWAKGDGDGSPRAGSPSVGAADGASSAHRAHLSAPLLSGSLVAGTWLVRWPAGATGASDGAGGANGGAKWAEGTAPSALDSGALERGDGAQAAEGAPADGGPAEGGAKEALPTEADLENLLATIRMKGLGWRRANRVYEAATRRLLQLHGTHPPPLPPQAKPVMLSSLARAAVCAALDWTRACGQRAALAFADRCPALARLAARAGGAGAAAAAALADAVGSTAA